jgi:SH3-like domain-containing protein
MPWAKGEAEPLPLFARADERSETVARLQTNVIANVRSCSGAWCRVTVVLPGTRDVEGFIRQDRLWGVYPNEKVE